MKTSWQYLIDRVIADVAHGMLATGTAKTGDLEWALVKRLPDNRIDMKVYNSVKYEGDGTSRTATLTVGDRVVYQPGKAMRCAT